MRPKLIAFEGACGTGKTSLATRIAERHCFTYARTPPSPLREIREAIESEVSPRFSLLFNLLGVKKCSDEWRSQQQDMVVDRYFYSSFVYCRYEIDPSFASSLLADFDIQKPDMTIVIEAQEDIRLARLSHREERELPSPFRYHANSISSTLFRKRLCRCPIEDPVYLDNSLNACEEVADQISTLIEERYGKSV